jgi:GT2 family glycosyltransferase/ubiquinone/menaquinone biosynthesis C-methylase UbiE
MRKTSIVIITYNNLNYTIDCIESIKKYTKKGTYEIKVIDNLSSDDTRRWLKKQSDLKIILNDGNLGFPKGCNQGIDIADPFNDILLLNNDTIVTTNWLTNMKKCLNSNKKIGAVGAVSNHNENLQGVSFTYDDFDTMQKLAETNNISDKNRWEEKNFLIGFCLLIKREVIDKVKYLDENYSPGYIDDNDFCLQIIKHGYKLMLCHDCFIHHYLGSAFRKDLSKFYPILFKNREYFKQKWGFETFAFDDIKHASLRILDDDKEKKLKILDINCGIGSTMLRIKDVYREADIDGIEKNKDMAVIASNFGDIKTISVENIEELEKKDYYDYILIGNILEKQKDPDLLIRNLKKLLVDGGYIIGEIHNISNYKTVLNLLNDKWYYEKNNFANKNENNFTKTDLIKLFYSNGFKSPFFLHWFFELNSEELEMVEMLKKIQNNSSIKTCETHYYSFKFQK